MKTYLPDKYICLIVVAGPCICPYLMWGYSLFKEEGLVHRTSCLTLLEAPPLPSPGAFGSLLKLPVLDSFLLKPSLEILVIEDGNALLVTVQS